MFVYEENEDFEYFGSVSVDDPEKCCGYGGDCDCDGQDCG